MFYFNENKIFTIEGFFYIFIKLTKPKDYEKNTIFSFLNS